MSRFFDSIPRFYEWARHLRPARLILRYEAIAAQNADIFPGARVLDIAGHAAGRSPRCTPARRR